MWTQSSLDRVGTQHLTPMSAQLPLAGVKTGSRSLTTQHLHDVATFQPEVELLFFLILFNFFKLCRHLVRPTPASRQHIYCWGKSARPSARCHDRSKRALTHVWFFWMHSSRMKLVYEHAVESAGTHSDCPEWLHFSGKASSVWRKSHHSCMCFSCSTCEDTVNVWKQMAVFTFHVGTDLLPEVEGKSIHSCVIEILRLLTRGTLPDHF